MTHSNYIENKLLDHWLGGGDFARPATLYFALFTSAPTDAGGGTEVSGGSYARAAVTNNATNFPAASGGSKQNASAISYAQATASWGTIVAVAIFDALSGGNMLEWALLGPPETPTPKTIANGDQFSFAIGDLTFTED